MVVNEKRALPCYRQSPCLDNSFFAVLPTVESICDKVRFVQRSIAVISLAPVVCQAFDLPQHALHSVLHAETFLCLLADSVRLQLLP